MKYQVTADFSFPFEKPTHKKNTLLKNAEANAEGNFFKRVFFYPPKKSTLPFFTNLFFPTHGFTANTTGCASNVNRFEQSVCGLQRVVLRTNSRTADNIRLKEITLVHPHTVA
jgi:hypothetical protein